jgi:hypothetical protein
VSPGQERVRGDRVCWDPEGRSRAGGRWPKGLEKPLHGFLRDSDCPESAYADGVHGSTSYSRWQEKKGQRADARGLPDCGTTDYRTAVERRAWSLALGAGTVRERTAGWGGFALAPRFPGLGARGNLFGMVYPGWQARGALTLGYWRLAPTGHGGAQDNTSTGQQDSYGAWSKELGAWGAEVTGQRSEVRKSLFFMLTLLYR